jgi:hypothetical protein
VFLGTRLLLADLKFVLAKQPNPFRGLLGGRDEKGKTWIRIGMQVGISLVVVFVAVNVLRDPLQSAESKQNAFGILGVIVGFWLR